MGFLDAQCKKMQSTVKSDFFFKMPREISKSLLEWIRMNYALVEFWKSTGSLHPQTTNPRNTRTRLAAQQGGAGCCVSACVFVSAWGAAFVEGCTGTPLFACCRPLLGDTAPPAGSAALRFPRPSRRVVYVTHKHTHTHTARLIRPIVVPDPSIKRVYKHTCSRLTSIIYI